MTRGRTFNGLILAVLIFAGALAFRSVNSADKPKDGPKPQTKPQSVTKPQILGGVERYLTHVSTDKPIYRAGEKVYVRGVVLEAHNRTPLKQNQNLAAQITIKGPKGDIVAQGMTNTQSSTLGFSWPVPAGQAGGEYTAEVSYPWTGQPVSKRKFEIRAYRAPRLKSQIEFVREGYGPGDEVVASLKVERAEGGFPAGAKVTLRARVDGQQVYEAPAVVDALGLCSARFELPKTIKRGEGTLSFAIEDGGVVETAAKTIPILLQTVDLTMYPEGGELVAGLPNRVYLGALTPAQKPADIAGEIVDSQGQVVTQFRTEHEGRGRFQFTPQADEKYTLKISEPAGIKTTYPLPEVQTAGAVLSSLETTTEAEKGVALRIGRTKAGQVRVTLSQREKEVASKTVRLGTRRPARILLDPKDAEGVLVATLWDQGGRPLAERLVFRKPAESLQISVTPDRERYTPGGTAKLKIKTTNAQGDPIAGVVGLTITDDSVLEMIEKREQAPRLPVMVFLENEVKDLADAHVYLDSEDPEAPLAVDLLLGTQGWRRFAFLNTKDFLSEHGDKARTVLAFTVPTRFARNRFMRFGGGFAPGFGGAGGFGGGGLGGAPVDNFAAPQGAAEVADGVPVPSAAPNEGAPPPKPEAPPRPAIDPNKADVKKARVGEKRPARGPVAGKPQAQNRPAQAPAEPAPKQARELQQALEAELREADQKDDILGLDARGRRRGNKAVQMVVVREYAHQLRPNRQPNQRQDFTETLYWNAGIKTDAKTGEASVSFALSDAVTSFRVMADAFDQSGTLGEATTKVESVEPFYTEPKLPIEVTSGDVIQLPVGVVNSTTNPLSNGTLSLTAEGLANLDARPFNLGPDGRERILLPLKIGDKPGEVDVVLNAKAGPYADQVTRKLKVQSLGFPVEIAQAGTLDGDDNKQHKITIPQTVVDGSLTTKIAVYPNPMASLTGALERMIREPNGCFEQTSSTTYPLVMAQQYFQSHAGVDPDLMKRSNAMLEKGYKRLIGYECKSGGYEWFGADPGHEALTAYGLMEFTDMAEVFPVDTEMLSRTRDWLLNQRDGNGGFNRKRRALHTWVVDKDISNAYITWALLNAGEKDLDQEVATVLQAAETTKNSYVLALAANVMVLAGDKPAANKLLDRLIQLQEIDGRIKGATGSIVGSGGQALEIETTSLATLAWLSDIDYIDFADKGVRYLSDVCKGGRFGNTQSTVLALKAIVAYDKAQAHPKVKGHVQLVVDGKPAGQPKAFDTDTKGAIELPDISQLLTPGGHEIVVQMIGGSRMPYTVAINLHSEKPASSDECQMKLEVALANKTVKEGAVTEAQVLCENTSNEVVPTPVAIIGIPGGLEVRHDQLKELVKSEKIAAYEVLGREVILYWREMKARQKVQFPLSLVAAIPGEYTGPASRSYLYYTDEHKQWVDPLHVVVNPIEKN